MAHKPITRKGVRSVSSVFRGMDMFGEKRKDAIEKHASGVGANVGQVPSFWYSPELTPESWLLPKSRQEILKWCRIFYNLEPYVRTAIDMHAYYPFSMFDIVCEDPKIEDFYKDMAFNDNFDLYRHTLRSSLSYQKFGEAIMFGNRVEVEEGEFKGKQKWGKFILLEPELVEIRQGVLDQTPVFELVPTDELVRLVKSEDLDEETRKKIPQVVMEAVKAGKNIPLDPNNVSMIANITDPSATRGTSIIQSVFKVLILHDKARLAQLAILDRYHFPVELWTVGDVANNILPTDDDLESVKQMINMAIQQPPFSMIFPPILKYEAVGVMGKLLPLRDDYDYILDQLMVGLGVTKGVLTGEGPSFSNLKSMNLQKLFMMYQAVRDEFEQWIINKFFRPIAEANGFTEKNKPSKLMLPKISWYKSLNIEQDQEEKDEFRKMWESGIISTKTLFSKYPSLDYNTEKTLLEEEKSTIFDSGTRLPKQYLPGSSTPTTSPTVTEEVSEEVIEEVPTEEIPEAEAPAETEVETPVTEETPPAV